MLSHASSQTLTGDNTLLLAQIYLEQARQQKIGQNFEVSLSLYNQAKVTFKRVADKHSLVPTLSQLKEAFTKAHTPQTPEDQALRQRFAEIYFERGEVLKALKQDDKAEAS